MIPKLLPATANVSRNTSHIRRRSHRISVLHFWQWSAAMPMRRLGTSCMNSVLKPQALRTNRITTKRLLPKLVKKTLAIALTDELPTSRAIFLVSRVGRDSGHPDIAWEFAKANMKALLAKVDAAGANRYAPSLFTFFSDSSRADEIKNYAAKRLAPASAPEVAKVVDEIQFRAEFRERLASQLPALIHSGAK